MWPPCNTILHSPNCFGSWKLILKRSHFHTTCSHCHLSMISFNLRRLRCGSTWSRACSSRCCSSSSSPGMNCIKIGLPGKSILWDYFQENRTSQRPFLLLRISFPGRPFFIQFIPALFRSGTQFAPSLRAELATNLSTDPIFLKTFRADARAWATYWGSWWDVKWWSVGLPPVVLR